MCDREEMGRSVVVLKACVMDDGVQRSSPFPALLSPLLPADGKWPSGAAEGSDGPKVELQSESPVSMPVAPLGVLALLC